MARKKGVIPTKAEARRFTRGKGNAAAIRELNRGFAANAKGRGAKAIASGYKTAAKNYGADRSH